MTIDRPKKGHYTDKKGEVARMLRLAGCKIENSDGNTAAYELLARLWQEETGRDLLAIAYTERGKPYFAGENAHFSITHTKRYAFCALCDRPVGIDAEELDRPVSIHLAKHILSPGELIQYQNADDPQRALLTFWVLKEAAAKETGKGIRGYPNHTNFSLTDPRVRELQGCLVAVVQGEDYAV
jgi:phosphopantetheine--protein transferase-like protein